MISIIIPTKNEEFLLPRLLRDIRHQTFTDYEVIVADAGSSDRTRDIAKDFGCTVVEGGLPGPGRNNGAKHAKGDFFIFFDADVTIPHDFIEKAFAEFQEKYLEVATCAYNPDSQRYKNWFELYNTYAKVFQHVRPSCGGAFMLMTRRIFDRVGGFDESLKLAEDHNFVKRASQYAKFRILENVSLTLSVRRFKKEGIIKFVSRALRSELYRSFIGEIKDDRFGYELGNYNLSSEEKEHILDDKKKMKDLGRKLRATMKKNKQKRKVQKKQKRIERKP
ncbi:MAG: glycosyltransferase [Candidatus Woesearchaeota archaeon]